MKPTPRQQKLIEKVLVQASYWENTNDIDSPTHYGDLEEDIKLLVMDDVLTKEEGQKFEDLVADLYDFIKSKKF